MTENDGLSEQSRPRRTTGRIIVSGNSGRLPPTAAHQVDDIPFVPAFDLLEQAEKGPPTEHEIASIAATLWNEAPTTFDGRSTAWQIATRILAVSQRL